MKVVRFEDLIVWQKSKSLGVWVYRKFKDSKDFTFKDQITRAAISVSNNIAEGFERNTDNDFSRFLHISKGSNSEVKSMLYLAKDLEIITKEDFDVGIDHCNQIGRLLNALINSIKPKN